MAKNDCKNVGLAYKRTWAYRLIGCLCLMLYTSVLYAESVLYEDQTLWLRFWLDTDTHEATVGDGTQDEYNAFAYPPIGDPWWNTQRPRLRGDTIIIPDSIYRGGVAYAVVGISQYAFSRTSSIKVMVLPNTIRFIGGSAFSTCVSLKQINIPDEVSSIGSNTFEMCFALDSITLPSDISFIGFKAFYNCSALKKINIPGNCLSIGDDAFTCCDSLSTLIIEDGTAPLEVGLAHAWEFDWTRANGAAFGHIWEEYRGLFSDTRISYLYLGRNLEYQYIYRPTSRAPYSPFESYSCRLEYENNGYRQYFSHSQARIIRRIEFGDFVTAIPDSLLYNITAYNEVKLPRNVQYIGERSLCSTEQSSIEIPETCDTIGPNAFSATLKTYTSNSSTNYRFIVCKSPTPPAIGSLMPPNTMTIVPAGSGQIYRQHPLWGYYPVIDPLDSLIVVNVRYPGSLYGRLAYQEIEITDVSRLKVIGQLNDDDMAVINTMTNLYDLDLSEARVDSISGIKDIAKNIMRISFPQTISRIPNNFFYSSHIVDTLVIPSSISYIGSNAFSKTPIKHIIIEGPTTICYSAFNSNNIESVEVYGVGTRLLEHSIQFCSNIKKVIIGSGVSVHNNAFYIYSYDEGIRELVLKDGVDSICSEAFKEHKMKKITVEGTINYIAENVFKNSANSLEELDIKNPSAWCTIPFMTAPSNPISIAKRVLINGIETDSIAISDNVTYLSDYAFTEFKTLKKVSLSDQIVRIGKSCFDGCDSLRDMNMPSALEDIESCAFRDCSLNIVTLPSKIKTIHRSTFEGCTSLSHIELPESLNKIEEKAFLGCISLQNIVLPSSLKSIGQQAFKNCSSISSIIFPYGLRSIEDEAFANCSKLSNLTAKWTNPISIPSNTFNSISRRSMLSVPYNTIGNYYATGWGHISLIEDAFYTMLTIPDSNGIVACEDMVWRNDTDAIMFYYDRADSIHIYISPDSNFYVKALTMDTLDMTAYITLTNNIVSLPMLNDNKVLSVTFNHFYVGDVNADDYVDVGDISAIVNYIQKKGTRHFITLAADANKDQDIDVGDIVSVVNIIYDEANGILRCPLRTFRNLSNCYLWTDNMVSITEDHEITIPIYLDSDGDILGFQMNLQLPDNISVSMDENGKYKIFPNTNRLCGMNIFDIANLEEKQYQILCTSTQKAIITDGQEPILYITLYVDGVSLDEEFDFNLHDIRIADNNGTIHRVDMQSDIQVIGNNIPSWIESSDDNYNVSAKKYIQNGELIIEKDNRKYSVLGTYKD